MIDSTIIIYGVFAGLVAILVTVAIERFGGFVGGVLGTVPSTIVPAAAGVYLIDGEASLTASMSIVPLGMLINGMFLGVWIILPRYVSSHAAKLPVTTLVSLLMWAMLAFTSLVVARQLTDGIITELMLGLIGLCALIGLAVIFNLRVKDAPKGVNRVPLLVLSLRGFAAGLAIAGCLWLAESGLPFVAGLASAFPAIFLTSMVALWLSQGPKVPQGAAAPMMLGGASVSVYALIVIWSIPTFGVILGSILAWLGSVTLWTIPAFLLLRQYRLAID
ncbi:MAG TPA: hypothetical protein HA354_02435 [Candidatus Poseidoniaceae archaeon]|nr:MAG TPA: hypothetical protein D7I07_02425 [Candidatus Poseidoniales archaeon]HII37338.1 hypothetical protein [Candidatus Poseidoniaceae archaeon]|tara:strand:+ start:134 stop:961 length:828 start_codon:yes stop_codon:yes gene_type:complete